MGEEVDVLLAKAFSHPQAAEALRGYLEELIAGESERAVPDSADFFQASRILLEREARICAYRRVLHDIATFVQEDDEPSTPANESPR